MKIFVIGGAGFVGRRVVRTLAAEGHDVVSLDIADTRVFQDHGIKAAHVRLDLANFEDVLAAMKAHKPEVVINLSYMRETFPRPAMKVNILGMDNCFEAARLCDVGHIIYSTSIAVNGRQKLYGRTAISETDPTYPTYQYAVHKVFNEWQASEYRSKHGMCITGVRIAHASGTDKLVGAVDHVECIVKPALGQKAAFNFRDTSRCVVHTDDVALTFARIAVAKKPQHALYNTGGETLSLGELAEMVRQTIPDADIAFMQDTGGEEQCVAFLFNNERLRSEFGISYRPYRERVPEMIASARRGDVFG